MEQETPQGSPTAGKRWMKLDWDEWYPVYTLDNDAFAYAVSVEVPEDKIVWVLKVQDDFAEVQTYLENLRTECLDKTRVRGH